MGSLYEHAGGEETVDRLQEIFYVKVLADPLLKPLSAQVGQHKRCGILDRRPDVDRAFVFAWSGVPEDTRSLALIVDDRDAPVGTFTHWLAWCLDPAAEGVGEGEAAPVEGAATSERAATAAPCAPPGHRRHRYFFRPYAVDFDPDLRPGAAKGELERALEGHTLAAAELIGTYER